MNAEKIRSPLETFVLKHLNYAEKSDIIIVQEKTLNYRHLGGAIMATVEECKRELKKAIEHLDEISVARVEAKANMLFYEALRSGILKAISESVGDKDGHFPLRQVIEDTEILWGAELRHVVRRRDEAEEYLGECEEEQENARIAKDQAAIELRNALNEF